MRLKQEKDQCPPGTGCLHPSPAEAQRFLPPLAALSPLDDVTQDPNDESSFETYKLSSSFKPVPFKGALGVTVLRRTPKGAVFFIGGESNTRTKAEIWRGPREVQSRSNKFRVPSCPIGGPPVFSIKFVHHHGHFAHHGGGPTVCVRLGRSRARRRLQFGPWECLSRRRTQRECGRTGNLSCTAAAVTDVPTYLAVVYTDCTLTSSNTAE